MSMSKVVLFSAPPCRVTQRISLTLSLKPCSAYISALILEFDKKLKIYNYIVLCLCRVGIRALSAAWTGSCHVDEGLSAVRLSHPAAENMDSTSLYFGKRV